MPSRLKPNMHLVFDSSKSVGRIDAVIDAYRKASAEHFEEHEIEELIVNLITDLHHWCDSKQISDRVFAVALRLHILESKAPCFKNQDLQ
jgi:hypothetical protein